MADEFLRVGGRGEDGTAKAIQTDDSGILKVNPNRKVEEVILFDKEIRDNSVHVKAVNISDYKDFSIGIKNTHDASLLHFKTQLGGTTFVAGNQKVMNGDAYEEISNSLPLDTVYGYTLSKQDLRLEGIYGTWARFTLQMGSIPSVGKITVVMMGVKL